MQVRYFAVKFDPNLNYKQQIIDIAIKLNKVNTLLFMYYQFLA